MRVQESSMVRLIENLKRLKEHPVISNYLDEWEDDLYLNETSETFESAPADLKQIVSEVMEDLNEWLIADNGGHHYPNRETLNRYGYRFEAGESDAFGPLSSVIVVGNFKVVYG